jgi:5-methylcytosine-specific restriction endonuclease McrA
MTMLYMPGFLKRCSQCDEWKFPTKRYFVWSREKGLRPWCRACQSKRALKQRQKHPQKIKERARRYYQQNTERVHEKSRSYRQQNPEKLREYGRSYRQQNPEKLREYRRDWEQRNPDKVKARYRRYYQENLERMREKSRQRYQENPDKGREIARKHRLANLDIDRIAKQRRRARKRSLPDAFTVDNWLRTVECWQGRCAYCGESDGPLDADHFIPLSSPDCPGTIPANIVPACRSCNSSKHSTDPLEWLTRRFGEEYAQAKYAEILTYFESTDS